MRFSFPTTFHKVKEGRVISDVTLLAPMFRQLHRIHTKLSRSAIHVIRVNSDRIHKRVCPRAANTQLVRAFKTISCVSGKIGNTAYLAFARPSHVTRVTTLGPRLLVLSFNAGRDRGQHCGIGMRCGRVSRLIGLLRSDLPGMSVLLAAPPNSCRDFQRQQEHHACTIGPHATATSRAVQHCTGRRHLLM